LLLTVFCPTSRADELPKLRSRGAEVYYIDQDVRAAFAKTDARLLPDGKLKLPAATAATFDWSTHLSRPFSYTQRVTPYCWAFAAVTAFEWNWALRNGGPAPVLAVQPIIDRSKEEGGADVSAAFLVLLEQGTCPLNAYPYTGKPSKVRPTVELAYRAIAWGEVSRGRDLATPEQIKRALLEHGPLVTGVHASKLFEDYKGGIFREHIKLVDGEKLTNHALVIVGWDDRKGNGCWKAQNSWGPKWGEGGFIWIEYGCNNIGQHTCWVRSQTSHYLLPADAHKLVPGDVTPFHRWSKAKAVAPLVPELPNITAEEAVKKAGERVVVEFDVKAFGITRPTGHLELISETNRDDEKCLIVRLLKSELGKFPEKDEQALIRSFSRKRIRVRGSVQAIPMMSGKRMIIEVGDPSQIEVVK
jgi:cathepsin L